MKTFQVLTDSTSNIDKKYRDEVGLDYLKMVFTVDGKTYDADLEWVEISAEEYYQKMRDGADTSTGLVKTTEFETKFEKYLQQGLDILYIACSCKLSGSCDAGKLVAEELLKKYPDRKIVCYDSLRSGHAEGLMAYQFQKYANEGMSLEDAVKKLDEEKLKYQGYGTVNTLAWLKKAGRIKASKAFFGDLFGVKPIIVQDALGNNYAYKKVKGRKKSLDELVEIIVTKMESPKTSTLFIEHADCIKDANYIAEQVQARITVGEIHIVQMGPIIGSAIGPGTIIVDFYGEKVTIYSEE